MILRRAVIAVLLVALAFVLAARVGAHACPPALAPAIWLLFLLAAFLFERQRYVPRPSTSSAPWTATAERFIDPVTGERFCVFVNSATGERDYRPL